MLPFESYSSFLVAGISQSGKTSWVHKLCLYSKCMFLNPVDKILYIYKHYEDDGFAELQDKLDITFTDELPDEAYLRELSATYSHLLLICDDGMRMLSEASDFVQDIVTRLNHHLRISSVFVTQNMYVKPKGGGQALSRCIHNTVFMSSAREAHAVKQLGIQLGQYNLIKEAYSQISKKPHRYLVVALHPRRDADLRFVTDVFPGETTKVYIESPL